MRERDFSRGGDGELADVDLQRGRAAVDHRPGDLEHDLGVTLPRELDLDLQLVRFVGRYEPDLLDERRDGAQIERVERHGVDALRSLRVELGFDDPSHGGFHRLRDVRPEGGEELVEPLDVLEVALGLGLVARPPRALGFGREGAEAPDALLANGARRGVGGGAARAEPARAARVDRGVDYNRE